MAFINYYNKDIAIYDNDEFITDCTMRDFILDNDGLTKDEIKQLEKLKVNKECLISSNCGYARIIRIK